MAKTPQLQCRDNGVYYYRARLPGDVLRAINSNRREWKRRTSRREAPLEAWSKLVGKNGEPKKELWYSLETRDLNAAKRALPSKQVELNSLFEQIIRLLTGEQNNPTMRDVERLAATWFAERDASRRLANLSPIDDEDTESLLREDLAHSQSQRPEDLGSYQKIAETLLFKEGFAADWNTSPVRFLVQLVQRGRIELCQRALGVYLGNYGKSYDDFFVVSNVDTSRQALRAMLYKATAALVRSYANIADDMDMAGYNADQVDDIKRQLADYCRLRDLIKHASGETLDLKAYEADMRHLIDTYIEAKEPRKISPFDDMSLLDIIAVLGVKEAVGTLPDGLRGNKEAVAETIENNVRSKITKERVADPAFYNKMSTLLDEIIAARKSKAVEYEEYLRKIAELIAIVQAGQDGDRPSSIKSTGQRALYNNLSQDAELTVKIDQAIKRSRHADWRGVHAREQTVKAAIYKIVGNEAETERIFNIVYNQKEY